MHAHSRKGSLLVDALLAVVIFGAVVAAFSTGILEGQRGTVGGGNRIRAVHLAREALEAVRSIRDREYGFTSIASRTLGQNDGVKLSGSNWMIVDSPTTIDDFFTRAIQFTNPNESDNERVVSATITWNDAAGHAKSVILSTYLTDWRTDPPAAPGGGGPSVDWSIPLLTGSLLAIDEFSWEESTHEAIAVSGDYAFIVDSNRGELYVVDVSDLTNPSLVNTVSSLTRGYDIEISGNYAYVATGNSSEELQIYDITDPLSLSCCTNQINLHSNGSARGISITGTGLFIARESSAGPELYVFDIGDDPTLANVTTPNPQLSDSSVEAMYETDPDTDSLYAVVGTGSDMSALYAYIASNAGNDEELRVVSLTGSSLTGNGGAGTNLRGTAVIVSHTGAVVGASGSDACEIFFFSIANIISNPNDTISCGAENAYDFGGDSDSEESANDFAISKTLSQDHLFVATDTQKSGDNYYFYVFDVDTARKISVIYDGGISPITAGYEADNGIFFRESDQTIFLVGGDGTDMGSDLLILQPTKTP